MDANSTFARARAKALEHRKRGDHRTDRLRDVSGQRQRQRIRCFENTATLSRRLLKIGGANAGGVAKCVSPAGEASRQRRSRIVTKCWNLAELADLS
jgi:hypothetical protein